MARVFEVYFLLKQFRGSLINAWSPSNDEELRVYFEELNTSLLRASHAPDEESRRNAYATILAGVNGFDTGADASQTLKDQVKAILSQYHNTISNLDSQLTQAFADPNGYYTVIDVPTGLPREQLFGGHDSASASKRQGGETYNYVTTKPYAKTVTKTAPCASQRRLVQGPGYWSVMCERTGTDGVKRCKLHRIDEKNNRLVYIPCESKEVQVLKGAQVDVQQNERGVIQQTVQPIVDKYKTVRALPAKDSGVVFQSLPRIPPEMPMEKENGNMEASLGGASVTPPTLTKYGGGIATTMKHGGANDARKHGGRVVLPDPKTLREKNFVLNDLDVRDAQARLPDGTIAQPNEWADMEALAPGVEYYAYDDDYGTSSINTRKKGFNFPFQCLPLQTEQQKDYLEWLIGVGIKMRIQHWDTYEFLYDPSVHTIASLESNILNGLAKLEAKKEYFSRPKLFGSTQDAQKFKTRMNEILQIYVFAPPTEVWMSPMSARYIDLAPNSTQNERSVQELLTSIYTSLRDLIQNGGGFVDGNGEGIQFPDFVSEPDFDENAPVGVVEAALMSLLSRMQFQLGFVVNFASLQMDDGPAESLLMRNQSKKFLGSNLKRYVDEFSNSDDNRIFIRLSALRLDQAIEAGKRLPPSTIPSTRAVDIGAVPAVTDVVVAPS